MDAVVDGTTQHGALQELLLGVLLRDGHIDFDLQFGNPAGQVLRHVLAHLDLHPLDRDLLPLCRDSHHGRQAGSLGGSHQVGWRKSLSPAVVVHRSIRSQGSAGGPVNGGAVKLAFVVDADLDHFLGASSASFSVITGTLARTTRNP